MYSINVLDKLIMPQDEEIKKFVKCIRMEHHKNIERLDTSKIRTIRESMSNIIDHHKKIIQKYRVHYLVILYPWI